jgi:DNA repair exonuclease SbcCD ATPase subunit
MNSLTRSYNQAELGPDASHLCMRLMCAGNEREIGLIRQKLLEAGIASETRRHPIAESLGVNSIELWVQNEQDFFNASKLYSHLQGTSGNSLGTLTSPKTEIAAHSVSEAKPQAESSSTPPTPTDAAKVDSKPAVQPRRLEFKQASSLLQKSIEEILQCESELEGECASLRAKADQLTRALAQAQADVAREIKDREAAERNQSEQLTGVLDTIARERREWQAKLKSSDDSLTNAKEQFGSLSRLLETEQAAAEALQQKIVALQLQRDEQERSLCDARNEAAVEREARLAADQRAGFAEESLQTQWAERQELERQIQASLGPLMARMASKATAATSQN